MNFPDLTINLCVYKRPYYNTIALLSLRDKLGYAGKRKFHIIGEFEDTETRYYNEILNHYEVKYTRANNLATICNAGAKDGGEIWLTILDDYVMRYPMDITPDVKVLLTHPEIGCIRLACLSTWGSTNGDPETSADLINVEGLHWWRIDKARTKDSYVSGIFCHLYHRRFWDDYGDIPECPSDNPGQAEINGSVRFRQKPGCTIAIPMRFGEDTPYHQEPFWHFGQWHADDYARYAQNRLRS